MSSRQQRSCGLSRRIPTTPQNLYNYNNYNNYNYNNYNNINNSYLRRVGMTTASSSPIDIRRAETVIPRVDPTRSILFRPDVPLSMLYIIDLQFGCSSINTLLNLTQFRSALSCNDDSVAIPTRRIGERPYKN